MPEAVYTYLATRQFTAHRAQILAQHIPPASDFSLAGDFHCSKFAIANQKNWYARWNQSMHISQKSRLFAAGILAAILLKWTERL
jgi:hypothetical protein